MHAAPRPLNHERDGTDSDISSDGGGKDVGLAVSPSSSRVFLIVTAVEEKMGGISGFWDTWGLLFAGKQVCWSVTREDS